MRNHKEEIAFLETNRYLYQNPLTGLVHRMGHRLVQQLISTPRGKLIDLGCGKGDHFPYMANCNFIGLDNDKKLLSLAKKQYPTANLCHGDIYRLSFADKSFDGALAIGVLEHLSNLDQALKEIQRILRPDKELVVLIPTENYIYKLGRRLIVKRHIEKKCQVDYNKLVQKEHVNSHQKIVKQLERYFKITKKIGTPFIVPIFWLNCFTIIQCQNHHL